MQVADTTLLFRGCLLHQPLPIDRAFAGVWIHRKVTDLKGGQILEEMAALRWGDSKIAESGFDNHAGAGDFIPFDRNTQPGFSRSPASNSDQQIRPVLLVEAAIELSDGLGHFLAAAPLKALRIDHYQIMKILDAAITQNHATLADQLLGSHIVQG